MNPEYLAWLIDNGYQSSALVQHACRINRHGLCSGWVTGWVKPKAVCDCTCHVRVCTDRDWRAAT